MNTRETTSPVKTFDQAYINGQLVTPHGTKVIDLTNPTDNRVIGKVTLADEVDTRRAIDAAKEAFKTFSKSSKEERTQLLQRLHEAVAKRMDRLVEATVVEYGAPQERAKGSNNLAANNFLHFKKVLEEFDLVKTVGTWETKERQGSPNAVVSGTLIRGSEERAFAKALGRATAVKPKSTSLSG